MVVVTPVSICDVVRAECLMCTVYIEFHTLLHTLLLLHIQAVIIVCTLTVKEAMLWSLGRVPSQASHDHSYNQFLSNHSCGTSTVSVTRDNKHTTRGGPTSVP